MQENVVCVVENGKKDIYQTLRPDIGSMRKFLKEHKQYGARVERIKGGRHLFSLCWLIYSFFLLIAYNSFIVAYSAQDRKLPVLIF